MATQKMSKKALEEEKRNKVKVNSILYPSDVDNSTTQSEAYIMLKGINKIYDNDVQAVFDFNLDIKKNEFIVFVGPSGCGKSTTLRMIAGLEEISSGELYINKRYSNNLSPKDRDIAMVFQTYALYPHMTVEKNLAFGLKIRKFPVIQLDNAGNPVQWIDKRHIKELNNQIKDQQLIIKLSNKQLQKLNAKKAAPMDENARYVLEEKIKFFNSQIDLATKEMDRINKLLVEANKTYVDKVVYRHMPKTEIKERVARAAKILEIEQYLDRKPKALSGGQRQRVALGRAIVRNASAFLMDEPLSNLDAKLRVQMRSEIVALHKEIGATTIYVTHDQTEAMTMADRIVVMKDGVVQQIGSPRDIYNNPKNLFVATFIGAPAMNILKVKYDKGAAIVGKTKLSLNKDSNEKVKTHLENEIKRLEKISNTLDDYLKDVENKRHHIHLMAKKECETLLSKHRTELSTLSFDTLLGIRPEDVILSTTEKAGYVKCHVKLVELLGSEYYIHVMFVDQKFTLKSSANNEIKSGDTIYINFNFNKVHLFDEQTTKAIY